MKFKLCEIVQQLEFLDEKTIKKGLENGEKFIRDYAYILHDKDVNEFGEPKKPHWHIAIRLAYAYDSKYICKWFDVPEQFVNKVKSNWKGMCQYLIHKNAEDKFQYDIESVVTNFDFVKEVEKYDIKKRKEEIISNIIDGTWKEFHIYDSNYVTGQEYVKFKKDIDTALKYRRESLRGADRLMDCIFITGKSGTGKSTLAKRIAKEKNYSIFVSSSSNDVLDGYRGEDCIILDDLRGSVFGLSDLLKLLDNHTSSSVKSRYSNKVLECKLIIITSISSLHEFYNDIFKDDSDTITQLKRRCSVMIEVDNEFIVTNVYNRNSDNFIPLPKKRNDILDDFEIADLSQNEALEIARNLLGSFADDIETSDALNGFERVIE